MRGLRSALVVGLVAAGLIASARLTIEAQEREGQPKIEGTADDRLKKDRLDEPSHAAAASVSVSVVEALERPFVLPFGEPTRLDEVCRHLGRILRAPVVLDRAALDRQQLRPDDEVQLELEGVRLKTGLKLLLDQVGLTYRVISEDNLLIVTDSEGSDDPLQRVLAELKALHRDVHNLQQDLDDLRALLDVDDEGPKMRKPTIIEEMPEAPETKEKEKERAPNPPPHSSTRPRPGT
jgi:hypothetical protein